MSLVYSTALKTLRLFFFVSYMRRKSCSPFPKMPTQLQCFFFAPGVKRPGHEVHLWPPCGAEVTNEWCYNSSPNTFMAWTGATSPVPLSSENTFRFRITTKIFYIFSRFLSLIYRVKQKNGNFWKTQQKLKKSNKNNLLTEIEPLLLAF